MFFLLHLWPSDQRRCCGTVRVRFRSIEKRRHINLLHKQLTRPLWQTALLESEDWLRIVIVKEVRQISKVPLSPI